VDVYYMITVFFSFFFFLFSFYGAKSRHNKKGKRALFSAKYHLKSKLLGDNQVL